MSIGRMDFLTVKMLEAEVKRTARRARGPNVVPFPLYQRWKACKRKNGAQVAEGKRDTTAARTDALGPRSDGPEAA